MGNNDEESCSSDDTPEVVKETLMTGYRNKKKTFEKMTLPNGKTIIYHPYYSQTNLAKLPEYEEAECEDSDREECVLPGVQDVFNQKDIDRILRESKMPIEVVLKVFKFCGYNAKKTIDKLKGHVVPELAPQYAKEFLLNHILDVKEGNTAKSTVWKQEFHFSNLLQKSVNSKTLVKTYYDEKKNMGGDFKTEEKKNEIEMTPERRMEMETKMTASKISFVQRAVVTKKAGKRSHRNDPSDNEENKNK